MGRGRPKGSKNKPKVAGIVVDTVQESQETAAVPVKRKPGRPKGSKGKGYTLTEKALAQRRENTTMPIPKTEEDIDYNTRLIRHIMQVNEIGSHADRNDILSLKSCFVAYLQLCEKNQCPVSNLAAYASIGMDYPTFSYFARKDDPEIRAFCASVRKTCAMFREHLVSGNKLNPVIGIFWQRNFDGLRNDTEQVQAAQEQEEDGNYGNSYKEKYKNLIGG